MLLNFWNKLQSSKYFYSSVSPNIKGEGTVTVHQESTYSLLFQEKGHWTEGFPEPLSFTNGLRWSLDVQKQLLSLEHLRLGAPIPLLEFKPTQNSLTAENPHVCKQDCYFATMHLDQKGVHLLWKITGPKKNSEIKVTYF